MPSQTPKKTEISSSAAPTPASAAQDDESERSSENAINLPDSVAASGSLERLVETARDYASQATAENTNKAYAKDWAHFSSWCRRRGADQFTPDPQLIGLYITECASPQNGSPALSVSTIERRLSGLSWNYQQRGQSFDRKDRHIATVLAGIRRKHGKPPDQKEPISPDELLAMVACLSFSLRDMRDRAILLIGYSGGLRRSEIVGLDVRRDDTEDGKGWIQIEPRNGDNDGGVVIVQRTKTGWKEAEIGRGSSEQTCPVHALEQWLHFAKIEFGPVFRRVRRDNSGVQTDRLSDKHVARLIKRTMLQAGIRPEVPEAERLKLFSGHSLRSGLASYADVDERYVQKQLGHASPQMTRRYQRRRDRFRVNLTKAAGL